MNRIILIGNGFDKAHGMLTGYTDFINNYWENVGRDILNGKDLSQCGENLISLKLCDVHSPIVSYDGSIKNYSDFENFLKVINTPKTIVEFQFKNLFFGQLSKAASLKNWVDVENEYYSSLISILRNENSNESIETLNNDFAEVRKLLEDYLSGLRVPRIKKKKIYDKILSPIRARDIAHSHKLGLTKHIQQRIDKIDVEFKRADKQGLNLANIYSDPDFSNGKIRKWVDDLRAIEERGNRRQQIRRNMEELPLFFSVPEEILFLTFNYTNTIERYITSNKLQLLPQVKYIYIHGKLNDESNPIIFGYGDELDSNYKDIEDKNDNRYLEYIKSTGYHKTDGYRRLLEFIESGYFQIFIMGHSCGNSDRTLLNTLFEHPNCMSIKPFYYQMSKYENNYSDIVRNISRCFKDKQLMRARVVNQTYCEPLQEYVQNTHKKT